MTSTHFAQTARSRSSLYFKANYRTAPNAALESTALDRKSRTVAPLNPQLHLVQGYQEVFDHYSWSPHRCHTPCPPARGFRPPCRSQITRASPNFTRTHPDFTYKILKTRRPDPPPRPCKRLTPWHHHPRHHRRRPPPPFAPSPCLNHPTCTGRPC